MCRALINHQGMDGYISEERNEWIQRAYAKNLHTSLSSFFFCINNYSNESESFESVVSWEPVGYLHIFGWLNASLHPYREPKMISTLLGFEKKYYERIIGKCLLEFFYSFYFEIRALK